MKYIYILAMLCLLVGCERKEDKRVGKPFEEAQKTITLSQAKKDIFQFTRLIEKKYGGYELLLCRGFDVKAARNKAIAQCKEMSGKNKEVKTENLLEILQSCFFDIKDNHFSLYRKDNLRSQTKYLCKQYIPYFSNIYVKKDEDKFVVAFGSSGRVSKGDIYTDAPIYLFPYPAAGKDIYRLGFISDEKIKEKDFLFNGKPQKIFMSTSFTKSFSNDEIEIKEIAGKSFAYVSCNSFYYYDSGKAEASAEEVAIKEKYCKSVKSALKKDIVILDIRNNTGGYFAMANSPFDEDVKDFSGTLYVLINGFSASASEILAYYLKNSPYMKVVTIGEKTAGAVTTCGTMSYRLKYSGLIADIPFAVIDATADLFVEGMGIMPDYWAFSGDVVDTLYALTGNEEIKEKLSVIE